MSSFTQICRLSNFFVGNYKCILTGRTNWLAPVQACNYTRKSAEEKLGLEKPKRPLTPYFKFMTQMRPALLAKNPGISSKEAISWTSKHWQQLDLETKNQMAKEYEKDLEDYKKIKAMYESSLTDKQKEDIKRLKEEMAVAREKRKLKAEYKELGRPKKPMSSYFLYIQSRKDSFKGKDIKQYQEQVKKDWLKLSDADKAKFDKQASELMAKYKKDLEAWEVKMISMGRADLVRSKPLREKKPKAEAKKQ
ncbi:transcription factor A, mitochondrial [Spodoptera frugiperda]|uniref:Transcription factor A, mitochondrial n=1 Tax=Spodoptera frugiperda TaxID=7108 RepID=A0A9R0D7J6_SPOFR|nr:transcription factor A, mitochondrial [Spodoptera frugiperda]